MVGSRPRFSPQHVKCQPCASGRHVGALLADPNLRGDCESPLLFSVWTYVLCALPLNVNYTPGCSLPSHTRVVTFSFFICFY